MVSEVYSRAAAAASRFVVVERTGSTNSDVVDAVVADPAGWPHLAVLVTDDQSAGRGRLGRTWTAPAGSALAVSVLLRVPGVPASARGWIPLVAGAAMARAVAAQVDTGAHSVRVKWPNDVLVDGRKISGILAETIPGEPEAVVVGAGVNTRMAAGELPVPTATSFAALGVDVGVDDLLAGYLAALDELIDALVAERGDAVRAGVHAEVSALCGTLDTRVRVSLPDGRDVEGVALRIGTDGELIVDVEGSETSVYAGDVVHVRPTVG